MTDLILINGIFHTMDRHRPTVDAIAISGNHIIGTGKSDEVLDMADRKTRIIDIGGQLGLPGFSDSHFHYYDWALGLKNIVLAGTTSRREVLEKVRERTRTIPQGDWIIGQGWNENDWADKRIPDKDDLDAVSPHHPVALWRCDLHMATVNSKALEAAGITAATPNPRDGIIEREPSGQPNGLLREMAVNLIGNVIPPPDDQTVYEAFCTGLPLLHRMGITGITDNRLMGGIEAAPAMRAWQRMMDEGRLDLRCRVNLPGERLDEVIGLGLRSGFGHEKLSIGHVKFFADGGMGARTAWMIEPYLDAEYGMPYNDLEQMKQQVFSADSAGLAVAIHAIGDRANRELISIFEALETRKTRNHSITSPPPILSHRIEHVQMIRPEDIERLSKLDIVACVQPHNMILDIDMIETSVGKKGKYTYSYGSMLEAGIEMIFSSDAPVCDPRPLVGIHALAARERPDGTPKNGWYPDQKLTVEQAVAGYTIKPANHYNAAGTLGSLSVGKKADIIILDKNIFDIEPKEILDTNVTMVIFDGKLLDLYNDGKRSMCFPQ